MNDATHPTPTNPDDTFPRVLVVTPQAFNNVTGGGVTMSNLFRGWPKDRLACLHTDSVPPATDVCERVYDLNVADVTKRFVPRWLQKRFQARPVAATAGATPTGAGDSRPGLPRRVLQRVRDFLFGGDSIPETIDLSDPLRAWIDAFRPDILYTPLGDNALADFIETVRVRWNLPLVIHVMDDWRGTRYSRGVLAPPRRRYMHRMYRHHVTVAARRMGICPLMCESFEREFGLPFAPFQNTIDAADWSRFSRADTTPGTPFRCVYAGSIFPYAQLDSLVEIATAVDAMARRGVPITLDIYSPPFMVDRYRDRLVVGDAVRLRDPIPHGEPYFRMLCDADLLLLPVNFDHDTVVYIRYSMPTKVPEYLLTGVPILAYGPPTVAQIDYAAKDGWARVVTTQGTEAVTDALAALMGDAALRHALSTTAKAVAARNHDARTVRAQFRRALREAHTLQPTNTNRARG